MMHLSGEARFDPQTLPRLACKVETPG